MLRIAFVNQERAVTRPKEDRAYMAKTHRILPVSAGILQLQKRTCKGVQAQGFGIELMQAL